MANATTRAKRLNETKMILRQPLLLIAIILSFALLLLFVIYPLAKTLIYSLTDETGAFSLANLITILQTPRYGKVFGRTMALGLIVAVIATFIGYVFAYTVTRVNVPAKGFFKTMATLPILSPVEAGHQQHLLPVRHGQIRSGGRLRHHDGGHPAGVHRPVQHCH